MTLRVVSIPSTGVVGRIPGWKQLWLFCCYPPDDIWVTYLNIRIVEPHHG